MVEELDLEQIGERELNARLQALAGTLQQLPRGLLGKLAGHGLDRLDARPGSRPERDDEHRGTAELLGHDHAAAARYEDGAFVTIYLAPWNYHRVHMPATGRVRSMTYVPGELWSVNATTVGRVPGRCWNRYDSGCARRLSASRTGERLTPSAAARSIRVRVVVSLVACPRITSTSTIRGAGFMKCIPITFWGRLVTAAILVMLIEEVLEAVLSQTA